MAVSRAAARTAEGPSAPGGGQTTRRVGAVLLALTLAACAHYHAQPLHPQQSADAFAARRLDSPELRQKVAPLLSLPATADWPPATWNRGSLFAVALADNPELAVARAEVGTALAREITAAQTPNPTLGLQAEYSLHDVKPWLYGISLDLPLRWPDQRRLEVGLSKLATSGARWQLMDRTWAVRQQLTDALSRWHDARQRLQLLDHLLHDQQRVASLEQRRVKAGEDSIAILTTVQQALLQATRNRAQARADVASAQAATATALGLPPEALDGLSVDWPDWGEPPSIDPDTFKDAREQALLSRADLAAAIGDYAAAEQKLQLAISRQYPQLSLTPGYYWDHGIHKFPLGFDFTLPIFNQNQGEIAEARANRTLAAQRMLALQARIYDQIASARRAESVARDNLDIAGQQLDSARQQSDRADQGLRLGAVDSGEQLAAHIDVIRARLERLAAQARLQDARNALENALHTPLSGPELALRQPSSIRTTAGATP